MELELTEVRTSERLDKDGEPEEVLLYQFRGRGSATEATLTIRGEPGALAAVMQNLNVRAPGDVLSVELKANPQRKISP